MIYVSIDLSIKSPGIAIQYEIENKQKTILFSFTEHKVPASSYGTFNEDEYVIIIFPNKMEEKLKQNNWNIQKDYFKRLKSNAEDLMKLINDLIQKIVLPHADKKDIIFSIEGYSYQGKGRTHDIAEYGGIMKYLIETQYQAEVRVVEPTTIKKFALKGKATKEELTEHLMIINPQLKQIYNFMKPKYIKKRSKKNPLYESPFNDLTDAYFLLQYSIAHFKQ